MALLPAGTAAVQRLKIHAGRRENILSGENTANAFDDDREASKNAGMNAHLSKSVNIVQIERTLSAEVARARHFRQTKDWK